MSDFTHLHVHSHYSLLDGLGKIDELIARTKELGMNALALTDHGNMYGAIEFYQAAKREGIKPILGVEAYLAPHGHTNKRGKIDTNPRHLTLLAANNQGYKNLLQLTTQAHLAGHYYRPRIDYELLGKYRDGLIVLSGCMNSDISQAIIERRGEDAERLLRWHLETFGHDHFYLEIQDHPNLPQQIKLNETLIAYSRRFHIPLVATADTHYIAKEDAEAQDVLVCVQTGKTVHDKNRLCMIGEDFSLKSPDELKNAWKDVSEAIENTQKITEMCTVELEFGTNRLPSYPLPPGKTADQALEVLTEEGIRHRYGSSPPGDARERLRYELDVIARTGFAPYFLIVADFVREARKRGILVGPGRGSAGGSLVSYLTGITNVDPLAYNLLFERFLNPERVSMPDIDLDFADDRRDEIIEYVRQKYGGEHVAQIITFGTMAARAAVRDTGRALGFPYSFCDRIAKTIPPFMTFDEALSNSPDLRALVDGDPQASKLIDTARKLEGVCRHASTHAAGVVITDEPLTAYVPLQLGSTGGQTSTITQYAMGPIEALGLLKIDFLGLKNLTIIQNTLERIRKRHNTTIDLDRLPLDDAATYQLLQEGKTTGVFQLESAGMKRYLKELKPTEFEDIISILALYRPGPMESIPDFIAAKHGRKTISYIHPALEPILEKTYGVIVTQDQVLQIAREFAGFTYGQADILRKAVGKKIRKLLEEQRQKFIEGAMSHKNVDVKTAKRVWDFIEPFARYGFNRAHATCYAMIAYQTAYLKAHYPAEFMAALLTSDEGNTDRQAIEVAEALTVGLHVLPPDVNDSEETFSVVQTKDGHDAIRFGLGAIKNVGHNVVKAIISERHAHGPYRDISSLFSRINSKDFNKKSVESLAKAGALDALAERNHILHNLDRLLAFNRALHRTGDRGQQNLFGAQEQIASPRARLEPSLGASRGQRLAWEKDLLGLYVSEHPLQDVRGYLQELFTPIADLVSSARAPHEERAIQKVRIAGVVTRITKIITKNQQPMLFVQIEDMTGKIEALVFPKMLEQSKGVWTDGAKLIIQGTLSDKDGERKILVEAALQLTPATLARLAADPQRIKQSVERIQILLPRSFPREHLKQLQAVLADRHSAEAGLPVELLIPRGSVFATMQTSYRIPNRKQDLAPIARIVGNQAIRYKE